MRMRFQRSDLYTPNGASMIFYLSQPTKVMRVMLLAVFSIATALSSDVGAKAEPTAGDRAIGNHRVEELLVGDIKPDELLGAYPSFRRGYETFEVEPLNLPEDTSVLLFFGSWCHDSEREVPRLLKLLETAGLSEDQLTLIALDYRKREPEGRAVEFNVRYTPTAIFMRDGVEVGRMVERPATTLHEEILKIYQRQPHRFGSH